MDNRVLSTRKHPLKRIVKFMICFLLTISFNIQYLNANTTAIDTTTDDYNSIYIIAKQNSRGGAIGYYGTFAANGFYFSILGRIYEELVHMHNNTSFERVTNSIHRYYSSTTSLNSHGILLQ